MSKNDETEEKSNNLLGTLLTWGAGVAGTVAALVIANEVRKRLDKPADLIEVVEKKTPKLSFLILGGRQVGKTSLIRWLRSMHDQSPWFELDKSYQPTLAQGADVPDMYIGLGSTQYNVAIPLDVAGEYKGPVNQWEKIYQDERFKLNGLIFMIDHQAGTPPDKHAEAWNAMIDLFKENKGQAFQRNIKSLYIVINKSDLWGRDITATDIIEEHYSEQYDLTKRIANRLNWNLKVTDMSIERENNVLEVMSSFAHDIQTVQ